MVEEQVIDDEDDDELQSSTPTKKNIAVSEQSLEIPEDADCSSPEPLNIKIVKEKNAKRKLVEQVI